MNAKPGDIWLADLGLAAKTRPVLIVSRHDPEAPRALIIYVPLTTQNRGSRYEVPVGHVPFLHQPSVVNVQGIGALVGPRLERRLGQLSPDTMAQVKDAIRFALDL
jgi:mRNA interferase MazF